MNCWLKRPIRSVDELEGAATLTAGPPRSEKRLARLTPGTAAFEAAIAGLSPAAQEKIRRRAWRPDSAPKTS